MFLPKKKEGRTCQAVNDKGAVVRLREPTFLRPIGLTAPPEEGTTGKQAAPLIWLTYMYYDILQL